MALKLSDLKQAISQLHINYPKIFGEKSAKFTVIPRSQCVYRCFDLRDIPSGSRRQALQLKISQWSPWWTPMVNIIWQNSYAQVWCWQANDNPDKNQANVVETRYFPRPEATQLQLLGCGQGYEAQYWQQGILKESHWWPEKPNENAWQNFQRAAGQGVQMELPAAETQKLAQPWGKNYKLDKNALIIALEVFVWKALPATVVFLLAWQGTQIYLLKQDIDTQIQQQAELSRQIEPILQTRNKIQDDQRYLSQVVGLRKGHRQIQLLEQVISKLPDPANMKVTLWEYQPDQLRFTIKTSDTDPSLFVKTYSALAWGKDVSAQPDAKTGHITVLIRFQM